MPTATLENSVCFSSRLQLPPSHPARPSPSTSSPLVIPSSFATPSTLPAHPLSSPSLGLTLPKNPPIPDPNPNPLQLALTSAKIGISVEDLASLPPVAYAFAEKKAERLALRVGENLFNFMQSFCGIDGRRLIVPMDILDRWFKKFQE
ncbi:hypothetical protein ZIOFF_022429 [Zingiber officinale]|uniref:Hikeshi-like C-terminal domain-containing protein n=1 Tax=Zingiber officinale TaxID=94328 RepID=A0A8J5LK51_ZINOF|nr:hypothetical protein ZIOFF_022429 [Zingiber officinale]